VAEDLPITVCFDGEGPLVEFPAESVAVSVPLTPVGGRLYRLDGVPVGVGSAAFRDVIEAEAGEDGRLRFVRVIESSGWRTYDFILPRHKIESEWGRTLLRELEVRGGHWEVVFGGLLLVCIPPGLDLDPTGWVASA
jgi:hypothetical protein